MSSSGLVLIDKPTGWSSFDVVNKVRGQLSADLRHKTGQPARVKVGHSGTLDPFATGLLIVAYGSRTKELGKLTKLDKSYSATLELGASSDTGDNTGTIQPLKELVKPTKEQVEAAIRQFEGEQEQVPPAFSAIKVDGVRSYQLAREGKTVELEPRQVQVESIKLLSYRYPQLKFECSVSSGTYIRTLAQDIAKQLGSEGYLTELRRLSIGKFNIEQAIQLDDLKAEQIYAASF